MTRAGWVTRRESHAAAAVGLGATVEVPRRTRSVSMRPPGHSQIARARQGRGVAGGYPLSSRAPGDAGPTAPWS